MAGMKVEDRGMDGGLEGQRRMRKKRRNQCQEWQRRATGRSKTE